LYQRNIQPMERNFLTTICLILVLTIQGHSQNSKYLGVNVLQLPTFTINTNLSFETTPCLSPIIDIGYTINYSNSIDYVGCVLTPHSKGANDGYNLSNQSGGYLRLGTYFNLRKDFSKKSYSHIGIFLTNSVIHEKGIYQPLGQIDPIQDVSQTKYIIGISASFGHEFPITKRLLTNIDFQISFPSTKYKELFGYRNYMPGMGFKDFEGYWFPMLIWNLKYRL